MAKASWKQEAFLYLQQIKYRYEPTKYQQQYSTSKGVVATTSFI
jgi:hypothetical protein